MRSPVAKSLRHPSKHQRVIPNKKKKEKEESFSAWDSDFEGWSYKYFIN